MLLVPQSVASPPSIAAVHLFKTRPKRALLFANDLRKDSACLDPFSAEPDESPQKEFRAERYEKAEGRRVGVLVH